MKIDGKEITPSYGVEEEYADSELTPEEESITMPKAKFGYSLICLIIVVIVVAVNVIAIDLNSAYTYVSVFFSDITYGYNPDKSPFDIYEILSDDALETACEKLGNKVDAETLKKHICVSGISDNETFAALKQSILDGNDAVSYFPSRYKVSYKIVSETIRAEGILASVKAVFNQFTMPSKTEILKAVTESYKEYYENNYITTSDLIFDVDWSETESLDYFNRAEELTNILNRMKKYTEKRYDDDTAFVSKDGISFGDLNAEISAIMQNDVDSYKSFVVQNGITADRAGLLRQFTYVLNTNNEQATRSRGEYSIITDGISIYDPDVTKLVFIPALDANDEFYMNRTKIGIDYLTEAASKANLIGDEAENNANYYEYLIGKFSGSANSDEALCQAADERCALIISKIDDLCQRAAAVNDEFLSSYSYNEVEIAGISFGEGFIPAVVSAVKLTVMWVSILCTLWFAYSFVHKKKKSTWREGKYTDVNS